MELRLNKHSAPFDLESTLQCGQLFRWRKHGTWWFGVAENRVFKTRQIGNILEFRGVEPSFVKSYFRLEDNLPHIVSRISRDDFMKRATQTFPGLRLVRQHPWECLISYICATYKSIPAIRSMIAALSMRFGDEVLFEKHRFHTFPQPEEIACASDHELVACGLGFRARRVRETSRLVADNEVSLDALKDAGYEEAKDELMKLPGVGGKVADCVLLFSLEKLEAFPVDVWVKRAIQEQYAGWFDRSFVSKIAEKTSLSSREYNVIGASARSYFGEYAGYAQEYLFHYVRSQRAFRSQA